MEQWFLVAAMYAGGTVSTSFGLPVQLGPMPSMEICLDVAQSMERAGKGRVMAGCTVQYSTANSGTSTWTSGPYCEGGKIPDPTKGCLP